MDLQVDEHRLDSSYGKIQPRVAAQDIKVFSGEPDSGKPYVKLADLVVQETPTVIVARSADEMAAHLKKIAWEKGADAVINMSIGTTTVEGMGRTSALVKGTAIRYKN